MNRRGFLTGVAGLLAAPAIVRVSSLMPVKAFPVNGAYLIGQYAGFRYVEIVLLEPVYWPGKLTRLEAAYAS